MFCERCKKKKATIHLTEILKNIKSEVHLCDECAKSIGLNAKLSKISLSVQDMLTFIDYNEPEKKEIVLNKSICPNCGMTSEEYIKNGILGCSECYFTIEKNNSKLFEKINKRHIGKKPINYIENKNNNTKAIGDNNIIYKHFEENIVNLHKKLNEAVTEERYEDAAVIRDKIKEKEKICKE